MDVAPPGLEPALMSIPVLPALQPPPSAQHHHTTKKKKSKKRKHEDDGPPSLVPLVPDPQPPSKKLKLPPQAQQQHHHHHHERHHHRDLQQQQTNSEQIVSSSSSVAISYSGSSSSQSKKHTLKTTSSSVSSTHSAAPSSKPPSPRITATTASPTAAQSTTAARPPSNELSVTAASAASPAGPAAAALPVAPVSPTPPAPQPMQPLKLKALLQHIQKMLKKKDTHDFFQEPVSDDFAPGYSQIIKKPMDFETMDKKIDSLAYQSITEYRDDFETICHNCMTYNAPDTVYYRAASSLLKAGVKVINRDRSASLAVPAAGGCLTMPPGLGDDISSAQPSPLSLQLSGELGDTVASLSPDAFSPSAGKIKKKRPSAISAAQQHQKQMVADITRQAQEEAAKAAERVKRHKFGFLEKTESGETQMRFLNASESEKSTKKLVDIAPPPPKETPPLKPGERRKPSAVSAMINGPYSAFAPVYDSTFSMLSPEESELLYSSYGNQPCFHYAQSLRSFVRDVGPSYGLGMVDLFLNQLTDSGHDKCLPIVKRLTAERDKKMNKTELVTLTQKKKLEKIKENAAAAAAVAAAATEAAQQTSKSPEKKTKDSSSSSTTVSDEATSEVARGSSSSASQTDAKSKSTSDGDAASENTVNLQDIKDLEKLGIDFSFLQPSKKGDADADGAGHTADDADKGTSSAAVSTDKGEGTAASTTASAASGGVVPSSQQPTASPAIVLHSPSAQAESVPTPSSTDLALLKSSLVADLDMDRASAQPSAAGSPAAVASPSPAPSRDSSNAASSEASPSPSAASTPGLPSLSALLERQLDAAGVDVGSGSERIEEAMDVGNDDVDACDQPPAAAHTDTGEADRSFPGSEADSQLKSNADDITQLVSLQSQRLIAVGEQHASASTSSSTAVAPSQAESATAAHLASGLAQLAAQAPPAAVLPNQTTSDASMNTTGDAGLVATPLASSTLTGTQQVMPLEGVSVTSVQASANVPASAAIPKRAIREGDDNDSSSSDDS
eukprot:scpid39620/ scgid0166/ Bromodomain-containing protein 7